MNGDDGLRKAIEALIAEDQAPGWQESLPSELAERIVALPELTAYAEQRARERAAEVVHKVARSLPPTQDREANRLHDAADALTADDRTGQR